MAFPSAFLDELKARLSIVQIVSRNVRLKRAGRGEFTGLCPFHNEKTPSFTVSEDKGFYHCFGCGAHGSAIDYVVETEGLGFAEAVEKLAGEAGMEVPQQSRAEAERARQAAGLQDAVEAACSFYESRLQGRDGADGLAYLHRRGLTDRTIRRFRLGWAPGGWRNLKQFLMNEGFSEQTLLDAGLLKKPDDDKDSFDFFRERVMFPVADRRGRIVAFGGRILGDGAAKYINSPDSDLFSKGRLLFNLSGARQPARDQDQLVVVEGYMDVIALAHAGFGQAVAPLGTAVTEDQIREMWRLVPEPVLCFDGDNAGRRAALRAAERAWPLLTPGQSLRFCFLPDGEDPDSLVRGQGRQAFDAVLRDSLPLADFIWRSLLDAQPLETPEQKAAFRAELDERVLQIGEKRVQDAYREEFDQRLKQQFGQSILPNRSESRRNKSDSGQEERERRAFHSAVMAGFRDRKNFRARPQTAIKRCSSDPDFAYGYSLGWNAGLGRTMPDTEECWQNYRAAGKVSHLLKTLQAIGTTQEKCVLACALNHPWLLVDDIETFALLSFSDGGLTGLQRALAGLVTENPDRPAAVLQATLGEYGFQQYLDSVLSEPVYLHATFARPEAEPDQVRTGWQDLLALVGRSQDDERQADLQSIAEDLNEDSLQRLQALYGPQEANTPDGDDEFSLFSATVTGIMPDKAQE